MPKAPSVPDADISSLDLYPAPVRLIRGGALSTLLEREWLVTNGLGGYACGTISGAATRRYHGLLIAAQPAPLGRVMMWNHLTEHCRLPDYRGIAIGGTERVGGNVDVAGADVLSEFRLELGLPVWRFELPGHTVEKRVYMPHRQNTVHISYRLIRGDGPIRLKLRPCVHFREHDEPVSRVIEDLYVLTASGGRFELTAGKEFPRLRLRIEGDAAALTVDGVSMPDVLYRVEENRGYVGVGSMWSPGVFRVNLLPDREVYLSATTEPWERFIALTPKDGYAAEIDRRRLLIAAAHPNARTGLGAELVLAADQFIISPAGRVHDEARANAAGDQARTIIAGYHWFTDWGRDTMIGLEGLTLATGRHAEAGYILRTFAGHIRDGLIPNFFPDRESEGVYHTADATLWFFHALHRYVQTTGDRLTLQTLLPALKDIVAHHQRGTRFGIAVDPADGLLRQGAEGYQLTWMDAKVSDWVVTPRRGKAVEINALWYNALKLLEGWLREVGDLADDDIAQAAVRVFESFNGRFWNPAESGLWDVVDGDAGDDPTCRPNQVFAISLDHPVLVRNRWETVLETVRQRLLTPRGLRSLAPGHKDYKSKYYGDLRARDAAYHQGTVWAWLIGPFIDAWRKTYPDRIDECRGLLKGFEAHLDEACVGSISEVFDAESPYTARGCVAQAWSVAEVLRTWILTQPPTP